MRHRINIVRPTKNKGTLGETQGSPEVIYQDHPCCVESLGGRELELARHTFAAASSRITMYGDPAKPVRPQDICQFADGVTGTKDNPRQLYIGNITDDQQNGVWLTLLCGEHA